MSTDRFNVNLAVILSAIHFYGLQMDKEHDEPTL